MQLRKRGGKWYVRGTEGGRAVKERPILFSGPMVRAILAGQKTCTRRVVKLPRWAEPGSEIEEGTFGPVTTARVSGCLAEIACPYGKPGDTLWVRETWLPHEFDDTADLATYRADCNDGPVPAAVRAEREGRTRWHSARYMPRVASRITLRVTAVEVQRLHDITADDAVREGISDSTKAMFGRTNDAARIDEFRRLWCGINGAESWEDNPLVWVVRFERKAGAQ